MRTPRARVGPGRDGLAGGWTMDGPIWKTRVLTGDVTRGPGNALGVWGVVSHRSALAGEGANASLLRVSVELEVMNAGAWPWVPAGAALLTEGRGSKALRLWPPEAIPRRATAHQVIVETELTEGEARAIYTLKLWDTSGNRLIELDGVTFP